MTPSKPTSRVVPGRYDEPMGSYMTSSPLDLEVLDAEIIADLLEPDQENFTVKVRSDFYDAAGVMAALEVLTSTQFINVSVLIAVQRNDTLEELLAYFHKLGVNFVRLGGGDMS
ncbi:hypothetical protein LY76DRAFT_602186 [Colletotrichum caudatum]|nr:hypothetical protein LY76DRAFT_602186 [Colletotrichum caudatum]